MLTNDKNSVQNQTAYELLLGQEPTRMLKSLTPTVLKSRLAQVEAYIDDMCISETEKAQQKRQLKMAYKEIFREIARSKLEYKLAYEREQEEELEELEEYLLVPAPKKPSTTTVLTITLSHQPVPEENVIVLLKGTLEEIEHRFFHWAANNSQEAIGLSAHPSTAGVLSLQGPPAGLMAFHASLVAAAYVKALPYPKLIPTPAPQKDQEPEENAARSPFRLPNPGEAPKPK